MNQNHYAGEVGVMGFPRKRGDEPVHQKKLVGILMCSPQARG